MRKDQVDRLKGKCYCRLRQKVKSLLWSQQLAHFSTHGFFFLLLRVIFLRGVMRAMRTRSAIAQANQAQEEKSIFVFRQGHSLAFELFSNPLRLVLITNCDLDEFKTKEKFCGVCRHITGAFMMPLPGNKDMYMLNFTVVEIRLLNFFQKKDLIFINPSRSVYEIY